MTGPLRATEALLPSPFCSLATPGWTGTSTAAFWSTPSWTAWIGFGVWPALALWVSETWTRPAPAGAVWTPTFGRGLQAGAVTVTVVGALLFAVLESVTPAGVEMVADPLIYVPTEVLGDTVAWRV